MTHQRQLYIVIVIALLSFYSNSMVAGTKSDIAVDDTPIDTAKTRAPETEAEKPRGQLLYENHCGECHDSSLHNRAKRKANSIDKIRFWVTKWSTELKLKWSKEEIDEVTNHVNSNFYHFEK